MVETGLADIANLLEDGPPSGATAQALENSRKFGQAIFTTAAEAWGGFLGKRVLCEEGVASCQMPTTAVAELPPQVMVTRLKWRGENADEYYLIMPALLAKDLVAHFLALAAGREADPAAQRLDDEAMDAYCELVNTMAGQATLSLASAFGEGEPLSQVESRLVDFAASPPALEFGKHERICYAAKVTIEGAVPMPCLLLLPPLSAEAPAPPMGSEAPEKAAPTASPTPNVEILRKILVPLVVILAAKRERMENIIAWRPGAIIEFRKQANELMDIYVHNVKIAEGEVVVINEHFGIQIRKLIDPRQAFIRSH